MRKPKWREIITVDGKPYLTRYRLFGARVAWNVYLHCFHQSDQQGELHSHPWKWAYSLILSGGYVEEYCHGKWGRIMTRTRLPWSIGKITSKVFHRVDLLKKNCWSLFFVGPRVDTESQWGFLSRYTREYRDWQTHHEAII